MKSTVLTENGRTSGQDEVEPVRAKILGKSFSFFSPEKRKMKLFSNPPQAKILAVAGK